MANHGVVWSKDRFLFEHKQTMFRRHNCKCSTARGKRLWWHRKDSCSAEWNWHEGQDGGKAREEREGQEREEQKRQEEQEGQGKEKAQKEQEG